MTKNDNTTRNSTGIIGTSNSTTLGRRTTTSKSDSNSNSTTTLVSFLTLPTAVQCEICSFLHPQDICTLSSLNRSSKCQFEENNDIWKRLWYRDYGNVLLQWNIGRQVLDESIRTTTTKTTTVPSPPPLEWRLSEALDQLGQRNNNTEDRRPSTIPTLKDFYFIFGEIYVNYLLAGRNTTNTTSTTNNNSNCYLGLHGHIFDFGTFAEYHPGLVEPILLECGRDATEFFEDLPHSSGARAIAQRLVVLIHRGVLAKNDNDENNVNNHHYCGLYLPSTPQSPAALAERRRILESSNTRPPAAIESDGIATKMLLPKRKRKKKRRTVSSMNTSGDFDDDDTTTTNNYKNASPTATTKRPYHGGRRPPTLWRIRKAWGDKEEETRGNSFWEKRRNPSTLRYYYDPFRQEWRTWDAAATAVSVSVT